VSDVVDEHALDIVGVGRAMKALPPGAWKRLVDTACNILEAVVAPITETAAGLGKLIEAKFERLVEVEKVLVAEAITSAKRKARDSGKKQNAPRPQILLQVIERAASEADSGIRELWSNLLANELTGVSVHPEIGRVLARLSSEDAQILAAIAEGKPNKYTVLFAEAIRIALRLSPFGIRVSFGSDPVTFNHAHLQNLGLIEREEGKWRLSVFGDGFIRAVTDPSLVAAQSTGTGKTDRKGVKTGKVSGTIIDTRNGVL
jgi:hypothetical protein